MIKIADGDFSDPRVVALLQTHLNDAREQTAPGSAHALDLTSLQSPGIKFWTIWDGDTLLGMGALKRLSPTHGEVKSMHPIPPARRKGIASAMLRHIIGAAQSMGISRLSLETGSWDYFRSAHALYRKHGFLDCAPFGDYVADANSIFMSLDLRKTLNPRS